MNKRIYLNRCPNAKGADVGKLYLRAFLGQVWELPADVALECMARIKNYTRQWPKEMIPFLVGKSFFYRPLVEIAYSAYQRLSEEDKTSIIIMPEIAWRIQDDLICVSHEEFEKNKNGKGKIIGARYYLPLKDEEREYLRMYRELKNSAG